MNASGNFVAVPTDLRGEVLPDLAEPHTKPYD